MNQSEINILLAKIAVIRHQGNLLLIIGTFLILLSIWS